MAAAFEPARESGKGARSRRPPTRACSSNELRVQYAVEAVAPASIRRRYVSS